MVGPVIEDLTSKVESWDLIGKKNAESFPAGQMHEKVFKSGSKIMAMSCGGD